jgi:hypothetical protein
VTVYDDAPAGRPPRWLVFTGLIAVLAGAAIGLTTWTLVEIRQRDLRAQCEFAVQARDDNRVMWLYLLEQFPGAEADAARVQLDTVLPSLECVGNEPLPEVP